MRRLVGVLILLALLVGLDFGVKAVAQQAAGTAIQRQLKIARTPDVEVDAFPFLLAAVRGRYPEIHVFIPQLERGSVRLDDVRLKLQDVSLSLGDLLSGDQKLQADRVHGTAAITEATLDSLVKTVSDVLEVGIDRDGVTISGGGFDVTTPADVRVGDGKLILDTNAAMGPIEIPFPEVVPSVHFAGIRTVTGKVIVTLDGRNVDFNRLK